MNAKHKALGRCAKSTSLDFEEAVRRALNGESPGANPPPIRNEAGGDGGGGGGGGGGRDGAIKTGRRDSVAAESKSEAKGSDNPRIGTVDRGADGVDAVRRGSGDGASRRGSTGGGGGGGGYDEKVGPARIAVWWGCCGLGERNSKRAGAGNRWDECDPANSPEGIRMATVGG